CPGCPRSRASRRFPGAPARSASDRRETAGPAGPRPAAPRPRPTARSRPARPPGAGSGSTTPGRRTRDPRSGRTRPRRGRERARLLGSPRSQLAEEVGAVAPLDLEPADLVVAHDLEGQRLARLVTPEIHVQVAPAPDLLGVEGDDHVALL